MENLTKKIGLWSLMLLGSGILVLSSCGNGELTKGKAEDALEEALVMFKDSSQFQPLTVGYFEVDDASSRKQLRKLAKAGMITYKVDKVVEHKKYSNYSWFSGRTYTTKDVNHYFATVILTEEGRKYVIENPVTEIVDKDMENKNKNQNIDYDIVDEEIIDEPIATTKATESKKTTPAEKRETEAPEPKSDYQIALDKQTYTTLPVFSHRNKIVKIKNIYCPEELLKHGKANCDYIYENIKVSPFGHVLGDVTEGERHKSSASFTHYVDKGWCVEK